MDTLSTILTKGQWVDLPLNMGRTFVPDAAHWGLILASLFFSMAYLAHKLNGR